MDGRQTAPGGPEVNQEWIERLQWLGIKVEEPQDKGQEHPTAV